MIIIIDARMDSELVVSSLEGIIRYGTGVQMRIEIRVVVLLLTRRKIEARNV
jgi:hypothetical protein